MIFFAEINNGLHPTFRTFEINECRLQVLIFLQDFCPINKPDVKKYLDI